jgi:hypothetical protein
MPSATRVSLSLLGLYCILQAVLTAANSFSLGLRADPEQVLSPLAHIFSAWPLLVVYLVAGLGLLAFPHVFAGRVRSEPTAGPLKAREWLALGITLIGLYYAVASLGGLAANMVLAIKVASLSPGLPGEPQNLQSMAFRSAVQLVISVALVVLARPLAARLHAAA